MNPPRRFRERFGSAWPVARRLAAEVPPQRARLGACVLLSLGAAAVELLRPWPLQWIVDRALIPRTSLLPEDAFAAVWTGALAYALLSISRAIFEYFAATSIAESTKEFTRRLRCRLFEKLLRLPPRFYAQNKTGDLIARLQGDVGMVAGMMTGTLVDLGARAVLILGTLAMLLWIDPLLALGTLAFAPLALLIVSWLSSRIHAATRKARRKEGLFADQSHESLANVALIQSLGRVDHLLRDFLRASRASARADCKASSLGARMGASIELLAGFALAIALLWGSQRVLAGHLSAGELLAFVAYVRGAVKPVRQTSRGSAKLAKGAASGERILAVLDASIGVRSMPGASPAPREPRRLAFHGVSYVHDPDDGRAAALSSLSCEFQRGQSTLIFGSSGAGKSTLAALAARLVDPDSGSIELDGRDLRTLELDSLRRTISVCPQDGGLFGWTIRENLLLARPDADDTALWSALRAAAADEFVRALPCALDTPLGTLGAGLSGGQRKRLSLARTFLHAAPVLILDEPYGGLDATSIERVHRTLQGLARDSIVIVIAHDRDELLRFDRVVFLEQGRVCDQGLHDELLRRAPTYGAAPCATATERGR